MNILPEEYLRRMERILVNEYGSYLKSFEDEPARALRVNTLKERSDEFIRLIDNHFEKVPWCNEAYYYPSDVNPGRHPLHEAGAYYIQEPSAMMPAALLQAKPGEIILDLCAAPGGKSLQIASAMKGKGLLISNEIIPARAKVLSENIERAGIINAIVTNEDADTLSRRFAGYFDKILVDAPCSGEGMFRKNPDAAGEWSVKNVLSCAERQIYLLDAAARMLIPGGTIVYSTCTFSPEENEGVVARFLQLHPDFFLSPPPFPVEGYSSGNPLYAEGGSMNLSAYADLAKCVRLWPHKVRGEGHFAAILKKRADAQPDTDYYLRQPDMDCSLRQPGTDYSLKKFGMDYSFRKSGTDYDTRQSGMTPQSGAVRLHDRERQSDGGDKSYRKSRSDIIRKSGGKRQSDDLCLCESQLADYRAFEKKFLCTELHGTFAAFGRQLYLLPERAPDLTNLRVLRPGLHLGSLLKDRFEPSHALALALPLNQLRFSTEIEPEDAARYIGGMSFETKAEKGWNAITTLGYAIGWGKYSDGTMKNHYPKGLRKNPRFENREYMRQLNQTAEEP